MSDELFPAEIVAAKSPRLIWLEKYRLHTHLSTMVGEDEDPWNCWSGKLAEAIEEDAVATGRTEHDAIAEWALKNHVRLWNEEIS
jgi:hypothetical protein